MERQILDVSQVNEYIKNLMDGDELLAGLCIRGELSNYKIYPSGHHYFTLKDAGGALRCVMFRSSAARLRFRPENGMKVLAMGRITVFPRDGAYQLYCSDVTPDGVGDLYVAFEQLKRKLSSEGLFDAQYKKPLPPFPHRILMRVPPHGEGTAAEHHKAQNLHQHAQQRHGKGVDARRAAVRQQHQKGNERHEARRREVCFIKHIQKGDAHNGDVQDGHSVYLRSNDCSEHLFTMPLYKVFRKNQVFFSNFPYFPQKNRTYCSMGKGFPDRGGFWQILTACL